MDNFPIIIFKIFERCCFEFIEDHKWLKDLAKSFQNLQKILTLGLEKVKDLPKSFQNLRKMLTLEDLS